ncbi:MAG TPA: formate--phosphoribosylaminoimidazolecarboxamide ligase family protein [Candidatus Gracilibacteria bacterium]|nr:formate--phosphoribosylaminoimidazolecarboxamide ligase family protein [Candidatus Gracilibacteria bacterium]
MISRQHLLETLKGYDKQNLTIGVLGGHSGLDVCHGAKKYGFRTVAVCQKGREKTYDKYYKTRPDMDVVPGQLQPWHAVKGCVDETIIVDSFADIVKPDVQQKLRDLNTIFVHNRYFWVYCDFEKIENDFLVPIFGTRDLLRLEERSVEQNQYYLLEQAGIRFPKIYNVPEEIDRLVLVKVNEAQRTYERAFFVASSVKDFEEKSSELLKAGVITKEGLQAAVIEEFVVGAHVNFNYFYSPIDGELELMGTDMRRQTNLDGLLRLTAPEQMEVLKYVRPKMIENGHAAVTVKESLIEKAFDIGEKFVRLTAQENPPGILGPFALQGAVTAEDGKEEIVIFDVSLRIPGSPGTRFTPYSGYMYGESMSYGERIAMEIETALKKDRLEEIVT